MYKAMKNKKKYERKFDYSNYLLNRDGKERNYNVNYMIEYDRNLKPEVIREKSSERTSRFISATERNLERNNITHNNYVDTAKFNKENEDNFSIESLNRNYSDYNRSKNY